MFVGVFVNELHNGIELFLLCSQVAYVPRFVTSWTGIMHFQLLVVAQKWITNGWKYCCHVFRLYLYMNIVPVKKN